MKRLRLVIDLVMVILLPLLMAYSLIGEAFHEVAGSVMLGLFIAHHILNRRWYGALFKGKYNAKRIFQTVLNMLLLVFMILQPISGILMSKHLYTFLPILPVAAQARSIHMLLAYWGYVLLCLHAGTHLTAPLAKLKKKKRTAKTAAVALLCGISLYGCYAFFKRGFPDYMFGRTAFAFFDYSEPTVLFLLDYLAIMALFMALGAVLASKLKH